MEALTGAQIPTTESAGRVTTSEVVRRETMLESCPEFWL